MPAMSPLECNSISEYLGGEFSRRKLRNKSYSLRAFARDLKMSPSRLSEVINGQEGISESTVDTIAKCVTTKVREQNFLKDLVLSEHSRNAQVRSEAKKRIALIRKAESFRKLKEDQFKVISDWYHGAIMELTQLESFKPDVEWVADFLGITRSQVEAAVQRLETLGLLERRRDGQWVPKPEAYEFVSDLPSHAITKFHMQILGMHVDSLREDPPDLRGLFSMILAIPRGRLPEFKDDMQKFITQFWQKIETEPKDELYSLSLQLCPVRNRRQEKTK
jgi:uncharacterized protein (TIGR02147 family)